MRPPPDDAGSKARSVAKDANASRQKDDSVLKDARSVGRAARTKPDHGSDDARRLRLQAARALLLPTEFVIAPLLGLYGGSYLDSRWGTGPWLMVTGSLLGLGAAVRSIFEAFKN